MIRKSTIRLLRIPFSINLLPIFLFAVYAAHGNIESWRLVVVFILIHFVFYPASNAYNSYMDADDGPIAGIKEPPAPTRELFNVSLILDILGLSLSLLISITFTLINLLLVGLSRAYSWHGIRIKKYPLLSFLMVSMAQGGLSYYNMWMGIQSLSGTPTFTYDASLRILIACLFVGAIYPLTQIYQHEQDRASGDRTLSLILGIRGTFILSGFVFSAALFLLYFVFPLVDYCIFIGFMTLPAAYFIYWAWISWKDNSKANFRHTMIMALGASCAMILAFTIIISTQILS